MFFNPDIIRLSKLINNQYNIKNINVLNFVKCENLVELAEELCYLGERLRINLNKCDNLERVATKLGKSKNL